MAHIIRSRTVPDMYIPENLSVSEYIFRDVPIHHDRIALIDGLTGGKLSFRELWSSVRRVANALHKRGFKKGDMVLMVCGNRIDVTLAYLAMLCLGVTVTAINPLATVNDIVERCNDAKITSAFVLKEYLPKLQEALQQYGPIRGPFVFDNDDHHICVRDLLIEGSDVPLPNVTIDPKKDVTLLPYSSGTSGKPKGVMMSHYSIIAGLQMLCTPELALDGRPGSTMLLFVPNFHGYGLLITLFCILRSATLVLLPRYTLGNLLMCIQKYKVTCLPIVPAVAVELVKSPLVDEYDLTSLEEIHCNSAPVGIELTNKVKEKFRDVGFRQGYGQTELPGLVTIGPIKNCKDGSAGQVYPNCHIKVIDLDTGESLGPNKKGEICMKSPNMMVGYLKRPDATSNTIDKEGFVHTGDIGYYDEDEYFYIVDRLKELIKYKGLQVPPASLEDVLLKHPAVADVAVIGMPDEVAGELPRAYIVRKPGTKVTEDAIANYVAERVAPYMKLRGGVQFTDAIPRSTNGKILRRLLRDQLQEQLAKSKL